MRRITNQFGRMVGFTSALVCLTMATSGCAPSADSEQSTVDALKKLGVLVVKNNNTGFVQVINVSVIADKENVSAAINDVAKLSRLKNLTVNHLDVSVDDLTTIGKMKTLIELNLSVTNLDDDGFSKLTGLTNLQTLYVAKTALTDTGMGSLNHFVNLKVIGLSAIAITKPLTALAELKHLQWVDLSAMEVSDEILAGLADVESLETISLPQSTYSPEAFDKLKQARQDIEFKL